MSDPSKITIAEWIRRTYPPEHAPGKATVWRWIRTQKIQPCPQRIGRSYHIDPAANHIDPAAKYAQPRIRLERRMNPPDISLDIPAIDVNVENVRCKMAERAHLGLKKYGVTTERTDLTMLDWLNHAQQESMDLCVYLERLIQDEQQRTGARAS